MTVKGRLDKLEDSAPDRQACTGAKELLQARFDKADPETRERLLEALSERLNDKKC